MICLVAWWFEMVPKTTEVPGCPNRCQGQINGLTKKNVLGIPFH